MKMENDRHIRYLKVTHITVSHILWVKTVIYTAIPGSEVDNIVFHNSQLLMKETSMF